MHNDDYIQREKRLAHDLGIGLMNLVNQPRRPSPFYRVLNRLYTEACYNETELDKKELAGLEAVRKFLKKIEHWAGRTNLMDITSSQVVEHENVDGEKRESRREEFYNRGHNKIWANSRLPDFDGHEREAIISSYLPRHEGNQLRDLKRNRPSRRAFLARNFSLGLGLLGGAGFMHLKAPPLPNPSDAQMDEMNRTSQLRDFETLTGVVREDGARYRLSHAIREEHRRLQEVLKEATARREKSGKPYYWEELSDYRQSEQLYEVLRIASGVGGALFGVIGAGIAYSHNMPTEDKIKLNELDYKLEVQIKNSAERLAQGIDQLLCGIAENAHKEQGHGPGID